MRKFAITLTIIVTSILFSSAFLLIGENLTQPQTAESNEKNESLNQENIAQNLTPSSSAKPTPTLIPSSQQASNSESTPRPTQPPSQPTIASNISILYRPQLVYASVGPTNSTGEGHDHFGTGLPTYPSTYYPAYILLNLTYLGNPNNESYDQKFEGYTAMLTADTGTTLTLSGYKGTNLNPSTTSLPPLGMVFGFPPPSPFPSISLHFNSTENQSVVLDISDRGSYGTSAGSLGLWSNGTPNNITLTIQRGDWIVVNGGKATIITNPVKEIILLVPLLRSGANFVLGTPPTPPT